MLYVSVRWSRLVADMRSKSSGRIGRIVAIFLQRDNGSKAECRGGEEVRRLAGQRHSRGEVSLRLVAPVASSMLFSSLVQNMSSRFVKPMITIMCRHVQLVQY